MAGGSRRRAASSASTPSPPTATLLEADVDEFTTLFNTILINLTGFFRDPAAWRTSNARSSRRSSSRRDGDEPIRMWSAGCATGEEAYTLAMVMAEPLGIPRRRARVKIYATDIDLDALMQARAAVYREKSLRDVPEELRRAYFEPDNHGTGLGGHPALRRTVVFGRHDLTRDPPISRVDLATCRNTLMYLNAETQAFVIPRLHYALARGRLPLPRASRDGACAVAPAASLPVSLRHRIFVAHAASYPHASSARRDRPSGATFDVAAPEPAAAEGRWTHADGGRAGRDGARGRAARRPRRAR